MHVITYPHPTLRYTSKPIKRVDADLKRIVGEMFELMYEHKGVGLAANQVDLPIRLFVVNLEGEKGKGEEQVFINPVVSQPKGSEVAEEGCLSLPSVYGDVIRPKTVRINAYNLRGEELNVIATGLFARVVQHETDHLNGTLFTDHMNDSALIELRGVLREFELDFNSRRNTGAIPSDEQILGRLSEIEKKYC